MMLNVVSRTLLIVTLACPVVLGGDWPQFRGPGGQGVSNAKGLPIEWSEKQNLVWRRELPGAGASSPIVLGDRIYLTCYSGYGVERRKGSMGSLKLHLVCVAPTDGKIIWDKRIPPRLPESARVKGRAFRKVGETCKGCHERYREEHHH